jgi:hypothetical protein
MQFGEQPVNVTGTPQTYVWVNRTNLPDFGPPRTITISSASLNNPFYLPGCAADLTNDFSLSGTCVAGAQIPPGGSCTISVAFSPKATGSRFGQATLRLIDPVADPVAGPSAFELELLGTAVAPTDFHLPIVQVVEYSNPGLHQYVLTSAPTEIAALDAGQVPGWVRTGQQIHGLVEGIGVCRYFAVTSIATSHWYFTDNVPYCGAHAQQAYASSLIEYVLEDPRVFSVEPPGYDGWCPYATIALYGLYDGIIGHRYTTDRAIRASMIAQGWIPEGLGSDGVFGCVAG